MEHSLRYQNASDQMPPSVRHLESAVRIPSSEEYKTFQELSHDSDDRDMHHSQAVTTSALQYEPRADSRPIPTTPTTIDTNSREYIDTLSVTCPDNLDGHSCTYGMSEKCPSQAHICQDWIHGNCLYPEVLRHGRFVHITSSCRIVGRYGEDDCDRNPCPRGHDNLMTRRARYEIRAEFKRMTKISNGWNRVDRQHKQHASLDSTKYENSLQDRASEALRRYRDRTDDCSPRKKNLDVNKYSSSTNRPRIHSPSPTRSSARDWRQSLDRASKFRKQHATDNPNAIVIGDRHRSTPDYYNLERRWRHGQEYHSPKSNIKPEAEYRSSPGFKLSQAAKRSCSDEEFDDVPEMKERRRIDREHRVKDEEQEVCDDGRGREVSLSPYSKRVAMTRQMGLQAIEEY